MTNKRACIVESAAKALHEEMERLDPTGQPEWEDLSDMERLFLKGF